jgi:sulfite exporter TauE/SafE
MNALNMAAIISAALFGSSHCVGMCGGFTIALGSAKIDKSTAFVKQSVYHLTYHAGRISVYACLGALFGFLGQVISLSAKAQGLLWFALGCFMMTLGVSLMGRAKFLTYLESSFILKPAVKKIYNFLKSSKSFSSFYFLGIFNGFIPCGLVYFFAASAVASGSALWGALIMIIFGLCTLPALLIVGLAAGFFTKIEKLRDIMMKIAAVIVIAYGVYMSYHGYLAAISEG